MFILSNLGLAIENNQKWSSIKELTKIFVGGSTRCQPSINWSNFLDMVPMRKPYNKAFNFQLAGRCTYIFGHLVDAHAT